VRDLVRRGVDAVWLSDEWGWSPTLRYYPLDEKQRKRFLAGTWDWSHTSFSATDRATFRKRYGTDMPDAAQTARTDELDDLMTDDEEDPAGFLTAPKQQETKPNLFPGITATNLKDPCQRAFFRMLIDAHNRGRYTPPCDIIPELPSQANASPCQLPPQMPVPNQMPDNLFLARPV